MKNRLAGGLGGLFVISGFVFPASNSLAAIEEFSPYAYVKALHDTNVFRDDDDEEDDTIGHIGAGLKSDLKLSRQHLLFEGEVDRAKYDNFGELDHTRVDGRATWAWEVGNLWSGDLGYRYLRDLSSFDEQRVRQKDMRTTKSGFFEAGYQLHPDWRLAGAFDYDDVSYQERNRLDRDTTAAQFDVQYRNTLNTRVGTRVRYSKSDLKEVDLGGVSISNDYDELTVSGLFYWEVSGKSALDLRLGYSDLRYDDLDDRDFQGFSGQLTHHWKLTGKTTIDISAWHETSSLNDEIASYVLTKGLSVTPRWSATPKITLVGEVSYEDNDFKGNNEIREQLGLESRDDQIWLYGISANWSPRRFLRVSAGYRRQKRDSSIDSDDFDVDRINAKIRFNF